ncbi:MULTISPECIES: ester cyclase [unclassified Rhizobium]|uniref:ester cyclase n=1 Tax=unclassified Rhizobium TaxID=2613769 RepID=UPI001ADCD668|nr:MULTISPECIES: ester cyclase [unclassified Rhizobium]MBO9126110.1 ester cyclase [Rhizobium sp. 16-488-2b]MBO9176694.1 ester cyclase [Rhizobium sp. 16-488-2a]
MLEKSLADLYRGYIDCLNFQDWENLGTYVEQDVRYNGQMVGLYGYRQAREAEFRAIPDLHFDVQILIADDTTVASRLNFNISPQGMFLGLPVNGRRISFSENVFYEFAEGKIANVWSIVDKAAIEAQLSAA